MSQPPQQPGPFGQPDRYGQPGYGQQVPPGQFGQPGQQQPGQFGAPDQFGQPGQQGQFGQQPGQYGQPDQFGQQGQFGQPGSFGQPGQPGQPGQFGQPGPFGAQPGGFGEQQPGYLPPGYRSADELPPPRRKSGRIVALVIAVVVAVGVGTGAYLLFFHKSGTEALSPDDVVTGFAQSYTSLAHSMSAGDLTKAKVYLCAKDQTALQGIYDREKQGGGADSSFSLAKSGAVTTNGSTGSFTLVVKDKGAAPETQKGSLVKQGDKWLVCDTLSD
jgi:hypothetical protein